jgi:hypothetical protein
MSNRQGHRLWLTHHRPGEFPKAEKGSHPCKCGRLISVTRKRCLSCEEAK